MRLTILLLLQSLVNISLGAITAANEWQDSGNDCVGAKAHEASNDLAVEDASTSHRFLKKTKEKSDQNDVSVGGNDSEATVKEKDKKAKKQDKSSTASSSKSSKSSEDYTGFSFVSEYMVNLLGIKKLKPKEIAWFEKQTASYVESYYNDVYSTTYKGKVTDIDVSIQVTGTYEDVTAKKSSVGLFQRRVEEVQLTVLFQASMSYRTTDPNTGNENMLLVPFQMEESKIHFMNDFLKTNGNFAKLDDISEMLVSPGNGGKEDDKNRTDVISIWLPFYMNIIDKNVNNRGVSQQDQIELGQVTWNFLYNNIGGPNSFTSRSVEITGSIIGDGYVSFQLNGTFDVNNAWYDEETRRNLKDTICSTEDMVLCCTSDSLNPSRDSEKCKKKGCKIDQDCVRKERRLSFFSYTSYIDAVEAETIFEPEEILPYVFAESTQQIVECPELSADFISKCCIFNSINAVKKGSCETCGDILDERCRKKDKPEDR